MEHWNTDCGRGKHHTAFDLFFWVLFRSGCGSLHVPPPPPSPPPTLSFAPQPLSASGTVLLGPVVATVMGTARFTLDAGWVAFVSAFSAFSAPLSFIAPFPSFLSVPAILPAIFLLSSRLSSLIFVNWFIGWTPAPPPWTGSERVVE